MRRTFLITLVAALGLCTATPAAPSPAPAPQGKKASGKQGKPKTTKTKYAVVKIGDRYEIVAADQLKSFKKKVSSNYKLALRQYKERKKRAARKREKFSEPRPKKERLKVLSSSLPSKEAAEQYVAKMQVKGKKKGTSRRRDKKKGGDKGKGHS